MTARLRWFHSAPPTQRTHSCQRPAGSCCRLGSNGADWAIAHRKVDHPIQSLLPHKHADEVARAKAREKKQNDLYEANVKKANKENGAIEARAPAVITGKPVQSPEQKAESLHHRGQAPGYMHGKCPEQAFRRHRRVRFA